MSIFKDSFTPSISASLEIRQKAMVNRTPQNLQYLNSRNAWVRVTSSVDVKGDKGALAKKHVLLGGIINENGSLKSGVGGWENAYSTKSAEGNTYRLGIRPMPGITSVDIKSKSAYGSLREIQINFNCWDIKQLEELELLYMRPGYTLLVEWGWAPYLDNKGNLQTNIEFYNKVLEGTADKETIWREIYNKANENGNYDAMFGYIKNYNWSARGNGGYDCQISVISIGEIIESLKINYSSFNVKGFNKGYFIPKIIGNESKYIEGATQPFPESLTQNTQIGIFSGIGTVVESLKSVAFQELLDRSYSANILAGLFFELYEIGKYTTGQEPGNTTQDEGAHITLSDPNISNASYDLFHVTININNGDNEATSDKTIKKSDEQVYIRLGSLLDLINNYVSLKDTKSNLSLSELTAKEREYDKTSSNNNGTGDAFTEEQKKALEGLETINPTLAETIKQTFNKPEYTGKGYLKSLTHPLQLSIDPRICLIRNPIWQTIKFAEKQDINIAGAKVTIDPNRATENLSFIQKLKYPYFISNNENNLGIIANIYVSLTLLYNLVTDTALEVQDKKEKNEILLYDFLKNMMSQVSPSIGNVNNFEIHVDPIDNKARIIDVNYVDELKQKDAYANAFELQMHNLRSTVRLYKLESQIFPEQSTIVAIGAQSKGGALGTNTNTLIDFNQNLEDRILKNKVSPTTSTTESTESKSAVAIVVETATSTIKKSTDEVDTLKTNFSILFPFLTDLSYTSNTDRDFDADKADSYKGALRDIIAYFQSVEKSDKTNRAIIPTKLSVEMDGIGGLIIGHIFKIPEDLLPRGYKGEKGDVGAKLGYVITGIGHSIQPNDWVTKIDAQTIILDEPVGGKKIDYTDIVSYSYGQASIQAANTGATKGAEKLKPTTKGEEELKPTTGTGTGCVAIQPDISLIKDSELDLVKGPFTTNTGTVDELAVVDGKPVGKNVAKAIILMKRAFEKDNPKLNLTVNSGFRSPFTRIGLPVPLKTSKGNTVSAQSQKELYDDAVKNGSVKKPKPPTAPPRSSHHGNSIAFDLNTGSVTGAIKTRLNKTIYQWLISNAYKFGFVRWVPSEEWHWEYRPGEYQYNQKVPRNNYLYKDMDTSSPCDK